MALALRIDSHLPQVVAWVQKEGYGGWACREVEGQNEHWHWILFTCKNIKTVRASLTRAVPLSGNGAYSLTVVRDVPKYERYICKGIAAGSGCDVVWKNVLEDRTAALHAAYWAERASLKRKAVNTLSSVYEDCIADRVEWNDRKAICKKYINALVLQNKPINLFSVRSNVNLLQCKLCPTDRAIDNLADQI